MALSWGDVANSVGGRFNAAGRAATQSVFNAGNNANAAARAMVGGGPPAPARTNSSGHYSAPPAPPPAANAGPIQPITPAPDIGTFLNQDTGYQQQMREFGNALTQFLADVTRRKGTLQSDYSQSTKAMGDQKVIDLNNLQADYGSRGIINSGLYGKAVGDYNTEYNNRFSDLGRRQTDALGQLDQEQGRFQAQQGLQSQASKEAAIRRRAEKYGV